MVRSQFVAVVEQVLVNGTSHWPMDGALGLGVVPQQLALVVGSARLFGPRVSNIFSSFKGYSLNNVGQPVHRLSKI